MDACPTWWEFDAPDGTIRPIAGRSRLRVGRHSEAVQHPAVERGARRLEGGVATTAQRARPDPLLEGRADLPVLLRDEGGELERVARVEIGARHRPWLE